MTAGDALALPRPSPTSGYAYGPQLLQFGELRVARRRRARPLRGGDPRRLLAGRVRPGYMSALADGPCPRRRRHLEHRVPAGRRRRRRLARDLRRCGGRGRLCVYLARDYPLDLDRVVAVGHSAGGHLALWLAARHRLESGDALRGRSPAAAIGGGGLRRIPDLAAYSAPEGCGAAVPELLGGAPTDPGRLRRASPIELVPLGIPQTLVTGEHDQIVPAAQAEELRCRATAREIGSRFEVPGAAHFELISPGGVAWPAVRDAVLDLGSRNPGEKCWLLEPWAISR